ncbi:MAG: NUDIX hydrolase [Alphaproteobacteria bacterium]|nr:NUDIX hydrolase [Alphaproteobacteria bacterium]
MQREYPHRPIVGVLAVVQRDGEVLIVQRGRAPSIGRWGFPGGVQELGETVLQAAERELAEETGIVAEAIEAMPGFDVIRPDGEGRIQAHWLLIPVICRWRSGDGGLSDEVSDLRWIRPPAIATCGLDVLPNLEPLATRAMAWRTTT